MSGAPAPAGRTYVRRRGVTPVPNATVYDERLSYAALGLLLVALARPEDASQGYRALTGRGLGEKGTRAALRELEDAGYRHQVRVQVGGGRFRVDTVVSEDPMTAEDAAAWLEEVRGRRDRRAPADPPAPPPADPDPPVDNPPTVRQQVPHGATSENTPSSQVAPCGASPRHGGPRHGEAPHVLRTQALVSSVPSGTSLQGQPSSAHAAAHPPGDLYALGKPCRHEPACPRDLTCHHGAPYRDGCALCRRGLPA